MTEHISTEAFLDAFATAWQKRAVGDRDSIDTRWSDHKAWTRYMLHKSEGLLSEVCELLKQQGADIEYREQWYTIDALFVSGKNLYREARLYPSLLEVVIEHENAQDVETEMWKLLFWRSPLKVLIFYDWTSARRKAWLDNKLNDLQDMIVKATQSWPEAEGTQYLVIAGRRNADKEMEWLSADSRRGLAKGFSRFLP